MLYTCKMETTYADVASPEQLNQFKFIFMSGVQF